ncbi:MAG: two-component sensor histidine kinase [Devosia sp. 67-54]|uniref:HAMP domain-containing sensor histidine kinase n=1 Tax=unclassified Devosia TaxID=196773 RepID=UPI000966B6BC|nr:MULTISPECIES: HAMP domain-containing sensor histidine kinase [unclassified Devosia]MBN9304006.1 HAMP domain-containing histidine kinase [Devosia sp.]OJX17848.1 MAG: two-component sensor histidine kinase [Devosia sp. 67-54]
MAGRSVPQKWRPTLAMIVFAVLLTVLVLPAAIVVWFRYLEHTSELRPIEIGALAVALVITVVIAVVFLRTITGPINALVKRAEAIGRGGRAAIVSPEQLGTREIATLSQSFLDLAERLVDRTEYVSSFAAHVSHELKSPITSIRGSAELLRDAEMSKQERARFLDHIIADADRLAALLERLRELARADLDAAPGSTSVAEAVAGQALVTTGGTIEARMALGPEAGKAVFGQLLRNAAEHGASAVRIEAARDDGMLRIRVSDNGSGVSPGNRDRVFEPFFTTRREAGGTGMGLQIVRAMLAAHGGSIRLLPSDSGATFELRVPLAGQDNT